MNCRGLKEEPMASQSTDKNNYVSVSRDDQKVHIFTIVVCIVIFSWAGGAVIAKQTNSRAYHNRLSINYSYKNITQKQIDITSRRH